MTHIYEKLRPDTYRTYNVELFGLEIHLQFVDHYYKKIIFPELVSLHNTKNRICAECRKHYLG